MQRHSHRHGLPPWDRTLDAVCHKHIHDTHHVSNAATFTSSLDAFFSENNHQRPQDSYFCLPDDIRFLICWHLLAPSHQDKPIRLNKPSFNRDVWRETDFQAPSVAFGHLRSYCSVSFAFRADILLVFLAKNTFHATFSPYVGPRMSPLATTWLNKYGPYMQNIVIEVDMTRLGYGPHPDATNLRTTNSKIETLLRKFVEAQLRREDSRPLENLVLLCRRFHGERNIPHRSMSSTEQSGRASTLSRQSDRSEGKTLSDLTRHPSAEVCNASPAHSLKYPFPPSSGTPTTDGRKSSDHKVDDWPASPLSLKHQLEYCPDADLVICNHLLRLRNRVKSVRMCGFSEAYTSRFIATLFPDAKQDPERHAYRVTPSTIWPRLREQKSYVDLGDGCVTLDDHSVSRGAIIPPRLARWEGCVQLPPPVLDSEWKPSLPPVVEALQRLKVQSLRRNTATSDNSQNQLDLPNLPQNTDRKRIMKLLERYGKTGARRKRALTREVATTL